MVSRIIKKAAFKSAKGCLGTRRKRSPAKTNTAAVFIASLNASLFKFFTKVAGIGRSATPIRQTAAYQCLSKLPTEAQTPRRALDLGAGDPGRRRLPPLVSPEKRTVVLDLDETLVHSKTGPPPKDFDFIVRPTIDGEVVSFYVQKRPGVDELLAAVAGEFEVVVFTAGVAEYASLVVDLLDRTAAVSHRLYRDSCRQMEGRLVKDLSCLGRDLRRVVIVDDNPNAYALQPENAVPVRPFTGDAVDGELRRLTGFLNGVGSFDDIRDAVKHYRASLDQVTTL